MDDPNAYQAPNERALASLLGLASPRSGLSMVVYSYQFLTCLVVTLYSLRNRHFSLCVESCLQTLTIFFPSNLVVGISKILEIGRVIQTNESKIQGREGGGGRFTFLLLFSLSLDVHSYPLPIYWCVARAQDAERDVRINNR